MTDESPTLDQPETQEEPGSRPLSPGKHEIIAQCLARGVSAVDAHEKAGYKRNHGNAAKLARQPHIQTRMQWLQEQLAKAMVFDAGWIKGRMGTLADALTEIIVDPITGVRKPGPMFNAHAGARVLELLGREQGIFKDKIELGGHVAVGNTDMLRKMKPEERSLMKEMLLGVLGRPPEPANDDAQPEGEERPQSGVVPAAK